MLPWRSKWIAVAVSALVTTACAHRPRMMPAAPADGACRASAPGAVAWITPDDPRDRVQLDRWCDTVGPPILEMPSRDETRRVDDLAIVSWNVHVGGGDLAALVTQLTRGDFSGGRPVRDYVLLLQEAFRAGDGVPVHLAPGAPVPRAIVPHAPSGVRRDVLSIARQFGLACVYVPSMRNGTIAANGVQEDRGNAILSTLPLDDVIAIELPFEHQRRVAVAATIRGQSSDGRPWELAVANVHLDSAVAWSRGGPLAARRRQAEALIEALDPVRTPSLLVAGDFNSWLGSDEPAIRRLRHAYPDALRQPQVATWTSGIGIGASLDYVFARTTTRGVHVRLLPSRLGSDHFPLLIDIRRKATDEFQ